MSDFERDRYTFESMDVPQQKKKSFGAVKILALVLCGALVGGGVGAFATSQLLRDQVPRPAIIQSASPAQSVQASRLVNQPTGKTMTPSEVYSQNVGAVCAIQTQVYTNVFGQVSKTACSGSGFILTADGYVVTNYHVIEDATSISVTLSDGTSYDAKLVGGYQSNDIALLKIEGKDLQCVTVGSSSDLVVGEMVAAIGNPLGELTNSLTVGYVSALDREINTDGTPINMLQTDASINSGNSGGPLFDMRGTVVGITSAKYSGQTSSGAYIEGLCFCIPIDDVMNMLSDLMQYGYVKGVAFLGVQLSDLDARTAKNYSLPVGPLVKSVNKGSCAEKAGVEESDIILAIGSTDVGSYSELAAALKKFHAGDNTTLTVYRAGQKLTLDIVLDEADTRIEQPTEPVPQPEENRSPRGYDYGYGYDYRDFFDRFFGFGF